MIRACETLFMVLPKSIRLSHVSQGKVVAPLECRSPAFMRTDLSPLNHQRLSQ